MDIPYPFTNFYIDLTYSKALNTSKEIKNLYLKIPYSQIPSANIQLNPKNLTVEIVDIDSNPLKLGLIEAFLNKYRIDRLIVSYRIYDVSSLNPENHSYSILRTLKGYRHLNISLDLYIHITISETELYPLLKSFPHVQHLSIYPDHPLFIRESFLGFKRYHLNMWTKSMNNIAFYDLNSVRTKEYLGLSKDSVTRVKDVFYRNGEDLMMDKEYIEIQDHIDRLNYYLKLDEEELKGYRRINAREYRDLVSEYGIIVAHSLLIEDLH